MRKRKSGEIMGTKAKRFRPSQPAFVITLAPVIPYSKKWLKEETVKKEQIQEEVQEAKEDLKLLEQLPEKKPALLFGGPSEMEIQIDKNARENLKAILKARASKKKDPDMKYNYSSSMSKPDKEKYKAAVKKRMGELKGEAVEYDWELKYD